MRELLIVAAAAGLSACATTASDADQVAQFLDRAEMCVHWAGEEPYDAERRAEIEGNLDDLRCMSLREDGQALRAKRADYPDDVRRIDEALEAF